MVGSAVKAQGKLAFVAAIVLVLQAFLTAWSTGAMPLSPALDAFGNPLCVTSAEFASGDTDHQPGDLPNCCTLGCSMVAPLLPAPAGEAERIVIVGEMPTDAAFDQSALHRLPDHDPGHPRAPPLTA